MTDTRRKFLKNAGKTAAIIAFPAAIVTTPAQAVETDLRSQLETVIHDLRNPHPDRLYGSCQDDLDTANRLAGIIGDEIIPFERYVWEPSDALKDALSVRV